VATTLESEVVKWASALVTLRWLSKAYIDLHVVPKLDGGVLIDNTSLVSMASVITLVNHCSNGGNSAMVIG
jgi:hypothetical protein